MDKKIEHYKIALCQVINVLTDEKKHLYYFLS